VGALDDGNDFLAAPLAGFAGGVCVGYTSAMATVAGFQIRVTQKINQRLQDHSFIFACICAPFYLGGSREMPGFRFLTHHDHNHISIIYGGDYKEHDPAVMLFSSQKTEPKKSPARSRA